MAASTAADIEDDRIFASSAQAFQENSISTARERTANANIVNEGKKRIGANRGPQLSGLGPILLLVFVVFPRVKRFINFQKTQNAITDMKSPIALGTTEVLSCLLDPRSTTRADERNDHGGE
jgi:hypothetical protein